LPTVTPNWSGGLIDRVHSVGALYGGDLDDDMWSIEPHNPAHKVMGPYQAERIKQTIREMDFVTCSTAFLRQRLIEVCGLEAERVVVIPNMVDFDLYDRSDWMLDAPGGKPGEKIQVSMGEVRRKRLLGSASSSAAPGRPVVIGLQGGLSHVEDWRQVAPALKQVAERYGDRIRFIIAGANFDYLQEALREATAAGLVWWKGWTPFLEHSETVMSFDINLCPLEPTLFNQSKSPIKYLEASAAGAASIVSPTVYEPYVQPGVTGLVARPDDWFEAISLLIDQPDLRRDIARNAHLVARSNFSACRPMPTSGITPIPISIQRYGKSIKTNLVELAELREAQEMAAYQKAHRERLLEMVAS
jgi:glycosyltransferase involved in cell wall biosynthesis